MARDSLIGSSTASAASAESAEHAPTIAGDPLPVTHVDSKADYSFLGPALQPGDLGTLGGYRVLRVLGFGGMGVVFEAEDPKLERHIALKVMRPDAARGHIRERFLQEAKAAAKVEHDHIVPIYHVDEDRGVQFLAMPLLKGESLEDRLKRERRLSVADVLKIGREMAAGLAAAHTRGLVHRDVKPANVWLEAIPPAPKFRVKILDFGLARRAATGQPNLTHVGTVVGTPSYMSPEQARGKPVDARADLFSLGVVMYRMATGELPFKGPDPMSQMIALTTETPPDPVTLNPELPPELANLIVRLLEKDAAQRPASAKEVARVLVTLSKSAPKLAPTRPGETAPANPWADLHDESTELLKSAPESDRRPKRSRPVLFIAASAIVVVFLAVSLTVALLVGVSKKTNPTAIGPTQPEPAKPASKPQSPAGKPPARPGPDDRWLPKLIVPLGAGRVHGTPVFSHDGRYIAVPGDVLTGYDLLAEKLIFPNSAARTTARSVAFLPPSEGALMAALVNGPVVRVHFKAPNLLRPVEGSPKSASLVAVPPDGRYFVFASRGTIALRSLTGKTIERTFDADGPNEPFLLRLSADGKTLAVALGGNGPGCLVRMWDVEANRDRTAVALPNVAGKIGVDIAFSPNNRYIAVADANHTEVWDYQSSERKQVLPAGGWLAFLPDARHLLIGSHDHVRIFDLTNSQLKADHFIDAGIPNGGALSSDGMTVAVVGTDSALRIYELPAIR